MDTEVKPCTTCGADTIPPGYYRSLPKPKPARCRTMANGECHVCRTKAVRASALAGRPIADRGVDPELVMVDWDWLHETGELTADQTLADRVRLAAPRIGMSTSALGVALRRAGITNPLVSQYDGLPGGCGKCSQLEGRLAWTETSVSNAARAVIANPKSAALVENVKRAKQERARHRTLLAKHKATHDQAQAA